MSKYRFFRQSFAMTLVVATHTTVVSGAADFNGLLYQVIITPPATVDTSATLKIEILDSDGNVIYTKDSIAAGATKSINLLTNDTRVPLCGTQTIKATFSAAQATNRAVGVVLVTERG